MNVCAFAIDLYYSKNKDTVAGYTKGERNSFRALQRMGYVDAFRHFHPKVIAYTYWCINGRCRNRGIRPDYFLVSEKMIRDDFRVQIMQSNVHNEVFGSDHCPISAEIKIKPLKVVPQIDFI